MAKLVTINEQLNLFDTIKSVLKSNSVIGSKFKDMNFYEFEPNLKDLSFSQLPYIVINIPKNNTEFVDIKHQINMKTITVDITLCIDYQARDKYKQYANEILKQIEISESTFDNLGYFNTKIDLADTTIDYIKEKQVIAGQFELSFTVSTNRF